MRKLILIWPLLVMSVAAAQEKASQTTFLLNVPSGAKSVLVHLVGSTTKGNILSGVKVLPLNITLSSGGIECSIQQRSGSASSKSTTSINRPIVFKPWPKAQMSLRPNLNRWTMLWAGTSRDGKKVSVQVLVAAKDSTKIAENLQPPQVP